jgi:hypothetical protein
MSRARLVIIAIEGLGRTPAEVVAAYGTYRTPRREPRHRTRWS